MELNGYYFRNLLKKTRRRFALSASEQALYQELIDICNDENWCTSFQVSNGELLNNLQCTEVSLRTWRSSLINAGLIKYNSGKSKRAFGIYTMVLNINIKTLPNTIPVNAPNHSPNPHDYNKLNKTKQKNIDSGKPPPTKSFKNFSEQEFIDEIKIYESLFEKDLLNSFFKYWKEKSPGGKMKFQLERTWETKLRLEKWKSNDLKYKNGISKTLKPDGGKSAGANIIAEQICRELSL